MTNDNLFAGLAWLPRPPEDFKEQCRNLQTHTDGLGLRAQTGQSRAG